MSIPIRKQRRRSLALRLTADGPVALIPSHMDADHDLVREFIQESLAALPQQQFPSEPIPVETLALLVARWSERIGVHITRLQVRAMRHKWGSISTAGTLTLADDLLKLPLELAEYVVVHELLHLKFPDHRKGWQVSMSIYVHDWRERERKLAAFAAQL